MSEVVVHNQHSALPQLAAATEEEAIALVNRWLHREVGMALNVSVPPSTRPRSAGICLSIWRMVQLARWGLLGTFTFTPRRELSWALRKLSTTAPC